MSNLPKWCTHTLRSYDESPIGGYPYVQTTGVRREFESVPIIEAQGKIVSDFRKGNGLPRATVKEAIEDIACYTCFRLGNMTRWCVPLNFAPDAITSNSIALNASSPSANPPCKTCGAPVKQ